MMIGRVIVIPNTEQVKWAVMQQIDMDLQALVALVFWGKR